MYIIISKNPKEAEQLQTKMRMLAPTEIVFDQTELTMQTRHEKIDAILVTPEMDPEKVGSINHNYNIPMYCVGQVTPDVIRSFTQAGVIDFFGKTFDPKLLITKHRLINGESTDIKPLALTEKGRVILSTSGKGGEGKTSFVTLLGQYMSQLKMQPVGIDADPSGNLTRWIGEGVVHSLSEFEGDNLVRSDKETIDSFLIGKRNEFRVLASPMRSNKPIQLRAVEKALLQYREHYENIIIDTEPAYKPILQKIADSYATDLFYFVTDDRMRLERSLETLMSITENARLSKDNIHVIANKIEDQVEFEIIKRAFSQHDYNVYQLPYSSLLRKQKNPFIEEPNGEYMKKFRRLIFDAMGLKPVKAVDKSAEPIKERRGALSFPKFPWQREAK